jgi:DNA-binding transcriptional regulator YhcF (GntR family)
MRWTIDHRSRERLQDQIAACVRRGVLLGELQIDEQLPPAAELGAALSVDRNTVLAAYRQLRDDGVLEFRRGRGARVASSALRSSTVTDAARTFIAIGRAEGLGTDDLIRLIKEHA